MDRVALMPLLLLSGCLYVGDLNHPPRLEMTPSALDAIKGAQISIDTRPADDDEPADRLRVSASVASADGQAPPDEACDFSVVKVGNRFDFLFFRTGTYRIAVTASDSQNATSRPETVLVKISNAQPTLSPDATLAATQATNLCNAYTAGGSIPLQLDGVVIDLDATAASGNVSCPPAELVTYTWQVTGMPAGSHPRLTAWDGTACSPASGSDPLTLTSDKLDQVCLWPDVGGTVAAMYGVQLTVSDGGDMPVSTSINIPVLSGSRPCLTGVQPAAGSYVVDPRNPAPFDTLTVDAVDDDLDRFPGAGSQIGFVWSLWRESDPTWRIVPISGNQLAPDFSRFGVGEKARIRVEAVDRTGARATCDLNQATCVVPSCAANTCNQWTTWDIELR